MSGVEILCSDKTGTLTKNKLSLHEVEGVSPDVLMLTACFTASKKKKGLDAIDKAFLKALAHYPKAKEALTKYKILEFHPFDPVSKKITASVESLEGEIITCVKGSPLFVLKTVEEDHPTPVNINENYENKVAELASRSFKALGIARKGNNQHWEILGVMPCMDPPRNDIAETGSRSKKFGIKGENVNKVTL